jgi:hypothetical protein
LLERVHRFVDLSLGRETHREDAHRVAPRKRAASGLLAQRILEARIAAEHFQVKDAAGSWQLTAGSSRLKADS